MSEKLDFKVLHEDLYRWRAGVFNEVDVPPQRYVALDGRRDPATSAQYATAIDTL